MKRTIKILTSGYPKFLKNILLHPYFIYFKIIFFPFVLIGKLVQLLFTRDSEESVVVEKDEIASSDQTKDILENPDKIDSKFLAKLSSEGYEVDINIICA